MTRFTKFLRRFYPAPKTYRRDQRLRPALGLEALEQRTVPTVRFMPHFGPEPVSDGNGPILSNPHIRLIFDGPGWGTAASKSAATQAVETALSNLVSGPYLSGTHQYRWNLGHAQFDPSQDEAFDPNTLPANFNALQLAGEVESAFNHNWLSHDTQALYVVLTPQGIDSAPSNISIPMPFGLPSITIPSTHPDGYHLVDPEATAIPPDITLIRDAWVHNTGNIDDMMETMSHEIVESITDPNLGLNAPGLSTVMPPGFTVSGGHAGGIGFNELGDGEAESYTYRLPNAVGTGGTLVQAYWSRSDAAFIVPDGNNQNFDLSPDYDASGNFLHHFHLTVIGSQIPNVPNAVGDAITVDTFNGGVRITFDQQTATFEPGAISGIDLFPSASGLSTINIESTLNAAPVTIHDSLGHDIISISPNAESLGNIRGRVDIQGTGADTLFINDQHNTAASTYTVTDGSVSRNDSAMITYRGLSSLHLNAGGADIINIEGTPCPTVVLTGAGPNTVNVGLTAHTLANVHGRLSVYGNGTSAPLNLYDQGDPAAETYTVDASHVTRTNTAGTTTVEYYWMTSLALVGSAGADVFNVEATSPPTSLYAGAGANTVNLSPTNHRLTDLAGAVTVQGNGSATTLNVNDQADSLARTYTVNASTVQSPGLSPITYSALSSLVLNVGTGADTVNVEGTSAPTTVNAGAQTTAVNVCPAGRNLDAIAAALYVNGSGGPTAVTVNDQANPDAPFLLSGTTYTLNSSDLTRDAVYNWFSGLTVMTTHRTASVSSVGVQSLTVNTGNYRNYDVVHGTAVPTTINAGSGGDAVTVGTALDTLLARLTVNAHGGTLTVDDRGTVDQDFGTEMIRNAPAYTLTAQALTRTNHLTDTIFPDSGVGEIPGAPLPRPRPITIVHDYSQEIDYTGVSSLTLYGAPERSAFSVLGVPAGTSAAVTAGPGDDAVSVGSAAASLDAIQGTLSLAGGGGRDALAFNDQAAPMAAGSLSGRAYTVAPGSLTRGSAPATAFSAFAVVNLTGTAYDDSLNLQPGVPAAAMDLELGAGYNSVYGPQTDNVWQINGYQSGGGRALLNGQVTLGGISRIAGGAGADRFAFLPGGYIPSTLNGGGGFNVLDYSQYPAAVTVNLGAYGTYGSATAVGSSVSNVPNVFGSAYGDTITGLGSGTLIGGDGNDRLTAGAGPSILIGGRGQDVLMGGAADDILIGGYTDYDTQVAGTTVTHTIDLNALADLQREWSRTDLNAASSYLSRVNHLRGIDQATPRLNNNHFLSAAVVHDDATPDSLTGAGGMDWFWGTSSEILDRVGGELVG